jgi:hypothetical protein
MGVKPNHKSAFRDPRTLSRLVWGKTGRSFQAAHRWVYFRPLPVLNSSTDS